MKKFLFFLVLLCVEKTIHAQHQPYVYTIKADSVKITNSCDTAELIIENHTQTVPGFLYNKGRGRTEFRRGLINVSDGIYVIGADTLNFNLFDSKYYKQGGNQFGATGVLGLKDNYPLTFIQNNTERGRIDTSGHWLFNTTTDRGYLAQFNGDIWDSGVIYQAKNISIVPVGGAYGDKRINIGGNSVIGDGSIALGSGVIVDGTGIPSVGIGNQNTVTSGIGLLGSTDRGVAIGVGSYAHQNAIAIGHTSVTTAANQFVSGGPAPVGEDGSNFSVNDIYFGSGVQRNNIEGPGLSYTINGSGAFGLSNTGGDITIAGGKGTGAGTPGNIIFSTASPLAPSSNLQSLSERARFAGSGNFLIGTTTDNGSKLQLVGNFYQQGSYTASFGNGLYFDIDGSMSRIFSGGEISYQSNNSGDHHLFKNSIGIGFKGTLVTFDPGSNPQLSDSQLVFKVLDKYVNPSLTVTTSGRVGIGVMMPAAQLHTTGTVRFAGLTNDNTLTRVLVSDVNGNLSYRDASSLAMSDVLNSSLAVNGTLSAQKIKITQTCPWPDYVFNKQYQLPSLTQTEQYIKQYNHLPGVPSAEEVAKKGIDVADNQAVLLKKIEELTLYVIEQEKKLQQQSEEITELKKQNSDIELLKQQMEELRKACSH
jgi:hypothetical protein